MTIFKAGYNHMIYTRFIMVLLVLLPAFSSMAQSDTVYVYFNADKKITQPSNAVYISKTTKEKQHWHKQVFVISNGHLYMDGWYADERTHVPDGVIKYYRETESITDSCLFVKGHLKAKYSFYLNGQVKDFILFTDSIHIAEQGGYTESGQRIINYKVWQPAAYPDSADWQKYIRKKVNRRQPRGYFNGLMEGAVEIGFVVDTTGNITDAKIIKTSGFIDLDQRALTIIEQSKRWMPALLDNHPVSSMQKQTILFASNEVNAQAIKTTNTFLELLHAATVF